MQSFFCGLCECYHPISCLKCALMLVFRFSRKWINNTHIFLCKQKYLSSPSKLQRTSRHLNIQRFTTLLPKLLQHLMNWFKSPDEIPPSIKEDLDAIIVLGGGVPDTVNDPPIYTKARCKYAAQVYQSIHSSNTSKRPKILALSAGTAHLPQLLSSDGLPVWESTASASYLMKELNVPSGDVFVETTSYDTITNAFFARTNFCDIADWKNILIVTNEFHMMRTKYIFDWVMNAEHQVIDKTYHLHYLSVPDEGLSKEALEARYEREQNSANNVKTVLATNYTTLKSIFYFINQDHSFYTAAKLVERANRVVDAKDLSMTMIRQSYGGGGKEHTFSGRINPGGSNARMATTFMGGALFGMAFFGFLRLLAAKGTKIHAT